MPQFFLLSESLYQLFKTLSTVLLNYFKSFQFPVDHISKTWYTVRMKLESNRRVAACAAGFALPRYAELPTVGLYRDQLACLIYIVVSKNVLSMENIDSLFKMQRAHYTSAQAYDTFCDELENYLPYVFGLTKSFSELEPDVDDARKLLRSTIISAVNKIYLDCVFTDLRQEQALWPDILPDLA